MIQTVTVGTDGSDTADKAVQFAFDLADKFGAKIVIASSYRPVSEGSRVSAEVNSPWSDASWAMCSAAFCSTSISCSVTRRPMMAINRPTPTNTMPVSRKPKL